MNNIDFYGYFILYVSCMFKDILWYDNIKWNKFFDFKNVLLVVYIFCVRIIKLYFVVCKKEGNVI